MDIIDEINLQTGDLILFTGNTFISKFIQYFQHNQFIHVGIIIKNPKFLDPSFEDGIYLLESGVEPTVQLNLLDDVLRLCSKSTVYVRSITCTRDEEFYQKLRDTYLQIKDTNIFDWIAKLDYNLSDYTHYYMCIPLPYKKTWCSSMTAYVFCKLGLIDEKINWTLISPSEFSSDSTTIQFLCQVKPKKLLF